MNTHPLELPLPVLRIAAAFLLLSSGLLAAANQEPAPPRERPPHFPLTVSPGVELVRLPEKAIKGGAMTTLKDGRIMLLYCSKDVFEPVGTSTLRAVYSSDGGKTWDGAHDILHDARYNPGRPTFLRARNGRLWLIYYGFVRSPKDGEGKSDLWVTSSDDDGKSWQPPRRLFEGYHAGQKAALETRDGRLVIVFSHAALPELRNVSASFVSTDDGRSWRKSNLVELPGKGSHSGALEPTAVELKDGRLWMLIRHGGFFHESFSKDGGLTWSAPTATRITNPKPVAGAPASLIRLADGRLAMAWNPEIELPPNPTPWQRIGRGLLAVAVSSDEGRTWGEPVPIARTTYLCYPHLIEYAPGQLLLSTGLLKALDFDTDVVLFRFSAAMLSR